jgi:transcriptional regulator with XRE-family HTH domain
MSTDAPDETVAGLLQEVGRRLRTRRSELGRTVKEVAMDAGLSLPYVANLENGRGNPTLDTLHRLASTLEVPLGELLAAPEPASGSGRMAIPTSLTAFTRTRDFRSACSRLAAAQRTDPAAMRRDLVHALASCPQPADRPMNETDWRRLLDAITLILT